MRTTWRKLITNELEHQKETWDDVVHYVLAPDPWNEESVADFDAAFDNDFGGTEGCHFTLWTSKRVYFPTSYDGAEGCHSAPRDPCDEVMEHVH